MLGVFSVVAELTPLFCYVFFFKKSVIPLKKMKEQVRTAMANKCSQVIHSPTICEKGKIGVKMFVKWCVIFILLSFAGVGGGC